MNHRLLGGLAVLGLIYWSVPNAAKAMLSDSIQDGMKAVRMDSSHPCHEDAVYIQDESIENHLDFLLSKKEKIKGATVCLDFDGTLARRQEIVPDEVAFKNYQAFVRKVRSCVEKKDPKFIEKFSEHFTTEISYDDFIAKNRKNIQAAVSQNEEVYPLFNSRAKLAETKKNRYAVMGNPQKIREKIQALKELGAETFICTKGSNCPFETQEIEPEAQMRVMREVGIDPIKNCVITGDTKTTQNISDGFKKRGYRSPDINHLYLIDNDSKQLGKFDPDFKSEPFSETARGLWVKNNRDSFQNKISSEDLDVNNLFANIWLESKSKAKPIERQTSHAFFEVVDSCMLESHPKWNEDFVRARDLLDALSQDRTKARRTYESDYEIKKIAARPGANRKERAEALVLNAKAFLDNCSTVEIPAARLKEKVASANLVQAIAEEQLELALNTYSANKGQKPDDFLARRYRMRLPKEEGGEKGEKPGVKELLAWKKASEFQVILDEAKKVASGTGEMNKNTERVLLADELVRAYLKSPHPQDLDQMALRFALEVGVLSKNSATVFPRPYWDVGIPKKELEQYLLKAATAGNESAVKYLLEYGPDAKAALEVPNIPEKIKTLLERQIELTKIYSPRLGRRPESLESGPNKNLKEALGNEGQILYVANKFGAVKECRVVGERKVQCDGESYKLSEDDIAAYSSFRLGK